MTKIFIILLSFTILFINTINGKKCGGKEVTASFKINLQCEKAPSKGTILMIGDCKPGTNKCKLAPPTTSDAGGVTSGNKKLADSDDELNLVVSHFCGKCKGSFKRQIPADGINCDGSTSKTHDFGTIELTEDKICTEAKSVYNRF